MAVTGARRKRSKHLGLWGVFSGKSSGENSTTEILDYAVGKKMTKSICVSFKGTDDCKLDVPEGAMGNLRYIGDHGTGVVRVAFDGSSPTGTDNPTFNARHTLDLPNVDLSQLVFNGSSTKSAYTVCYEEYSI